VIYALFRPEWLRHRVGTVSGAIRRHRKGERTQRQPVSYLGSVFFAVIAHRKLIPVRRKEPTVVQNLMAYLNARRDEEGQGLVEYALIVALIAVVAIGALTAIGGGVVETLDAITAEL